MGPGFPESHLLGRWYLGSDDTSFVWREIVEIIEKIIHTVR